ncbi:inosine-5-monophosphate dehydrogenase [Defluviimonas sp. 20V17]|uniref:CBS domain-containing protein n=1 Tax=Allgaiera indica TaxID=765699 RepID=A0AAN4URY7_9RHOB|nr:CBS domain-containing protein [Allgaiera indica]KDB01877.1 inosine-5-monophosphate dehydrogenase [Defluviimonas sp. 20V17]GHE02391.1 inosine-5-monophosphate dehydrogenase [Allgaiera indica]SDX30547.1 CBS domain-containing protein [Allgaiera indica]
MQVQHILQTKGGAVASVRPDCTVAEAAETLSARRIGALIVTSDGKHVEGILSERDIVRELGRRGVACLPDRVDALMTPNPISCTKNQTAREVLEIMTEKRFRHMPVVEKGEMIGLISIGDAVKARLDELAMENEALEGMIKGL